MNTEPKKPGLNVVADILIIDDDRISQKVIARALQQGGHKARFANDGESGLEQAWRSVPDVILLDVEMPGLNGYEVCDRLRNQDPTRETPVIFLSARSSLRERMLGYEVGADDYLVKPFEGEQLLARIGVHLRYQDQREKLHENYLLAQKAAMSALIGSSELSQAMQFMERSIGFVNIDQLAQGLLETLNRFSLNATLMLNYEDKQHWYASDGNIKPLEKELVEMSDNSKRFVDFGSRTLVSLYGARLLVRNMPVDDMERYGRVKDLLPALLSASHSRMNALRTQEALRDQARDLLYSFKVMRSSIFTLLKTLVNNRRQSREFTSETLMRINDDLLRMGLEEDQEKFLLDRIEETAEKIIDQMDAGAQTYDALMLVLENMRSVMVQQEELAAAYSKQAEQPVVSAADCGGDIELF